MPALISASYKSHTETVKVLINKGADVNAKNKEYQTSLMIASYNGYITVVKYIEITKYPI